MVAEADLGGQIPSVVQEHVAKNQAYSMFELNKLLPKWVKQNGSRLNEVIMQQRNE